MWWNVLGPTPHRTPMFHAQDAVASDGGLVAWWDLTAAKPGENQRNMYHAMYLMLYIYNTILYRHNFWTCTSHHFKIHTPQCASKQKTQKWSVQIGLLWRGLILKPQVSSFSLSLSSFVYLVYIDRHLCMTYDMSIIYMYIYMTWYIHIFVILKVIQTESERTATGMMEVPWSLKQNFRLLVPLAAKLGRMLRVWSAVFVTLWRFRGTTRIILMQPPHSQTRTEFMGWRSLSSTCLRFHEVFKEKSLRFAITSSIQGVDLQMT